MAIRAAGGCKWLGAWLAAAVLVLHVHGISGRSRADRAPGLLESHGTGLRRQSRSLKLDEDEARFLGPVHERGSGSHETRHGEDNELNAATRSRTQTRMHQSDVELWLSAFLLGVSADQPANKPYCNMNKTAA